MQHKKKAMITQRLVTLYTQTNLFAKRRLSFLFQTPCLMLTPVNYQPLLRLSHDPMCKVMLLLPGFASTFSNLSRSNPMRIYRRAFCRQRSFSLYPTSQYSISFPKKAESSMIGLTRVQHRVALPQSQKFKQEKKRRSLSANNLTSSIHPFHVYSTQCPSIGYKF